MNPAKTMIQVCELERKKELKSRSFNSNYVGNIALNLNLQHEELMMCVITL